MAAPTKGGPVCYSRAERGELVATTGLFWRGSRITYWKVSQAEAKDTDDYLHSLHISSLLNQTDDISEYDGEHQKVA